MQRRELSTEKYDVAIVGAGLSGLIAARLISRSGKRVVILEAQDLVGGRTWSKSLDNGLFIDIGGQWIGNGHTSMYKLAEEAGIKTFPTYNNGINIWQSDGELKKHCDQIPPIGLFALLSVNTNMKRFDELAERIDPSQPWMVENANEMDNRSLGSWIDQKVNNNRARKLIKSIAEGELCTSTYEV